MRRWTLILLGVGAWILAFGGVLVRWVADLEADPNYEHALPLLVILIAVGVLRQRRGAVAREGSGAWWAWGTGAVLLALAGLIAANDLPQRWAALTGALALVAAAGSTQVRGAWRAPLLAAFLLVPWPYVVYYAATSRLQRLSSQAAEVVLRFSGVPLAREGNLLHFPGYRLEVVEACGGLRSLLAMTALAAVVAAATRSSARRTLLLLAVSVPLALGTNLLRLVLTGWISQLRGPEAAAGIYHTGEGLVTFVVGSLLLGGVALAGRRESP